jgi:hypothetical protein
MDDDEKLKRKLYNQAYYEMNRHKWKGYNETQLNDPVKREAMKKSQRLWAKRNYVPRPRIKKEDKKQKKVKIEKIDTFKTFESYRKYIKL